MAVTFYKLTKKNVEFFGLKRKLAYKVYFSYKTFKLIVFVFFKRKLKQEDEVIKDWENVINVLNNEKNLITYWTNNYLDKLKEQLPVNMFSNDDETIKLLRTIYLIKSLDRKDEYNKDDYKYLQMEWALELKELIPN